MNELRPAARPIGPAVTAFFEAQGDKLRLDSTHTQSPCYRQHFTNVKAAIINAFAGIKNTALVLGAGGGFDLPLQEMGERFESVTLVDLSLKNMKEATQKLPEVLQGKFHLEQADLTGIFTDLTSEVEALTKQGLSFEAFTSQVVDLLPALKKMGFPYQNSHPSFICSSLVCSQLSGGLHKYLEQVSQEQFGKSFVPSEDKNEQYDSFFIQLQLDHVVELHRLAGDEGKVYFADHFSMKGIVHLESVIEDVEQELGITIFPGADKINSLIQEHFSVLTLCHWEWCLPIAKSIGFAKVTEKDGTTQVVDVNVTEFRSYQITSMDLIPI